MTKWVARMLRSLLFFVARWGGMGLMVDNKQVSLLLRGLEGLEWIELGGGWMEVYRVNDG